MTSQSARALIMMLCLSCVGLGTTLVHAGDPGSPAPDPLLTPVTTPTPFPPPTSVPANMTPASGDSNILIGTARDACEAMLCLAAIGSAPAECARALAIYHATQGFGMGHAFLAMCPVISAP